MTKIIMNDTKKLQQEIINEFSTPIVQGRYWKIAQNGFWESEEKLIRQYFKRNSSILEVGCGSGRTVLPLHRMGYEVTGVDLTPKMIEIAKKVATLNNLDISYKVGDATRLEFNDNSFDNSLFANNGWAQIPGKNNQLKTLKEIYRVIKPGGYYIFTADRRYYDLRHLLFWIKQFVKIYLLKPLGFDIKEIEFGDLWFNRRHNGKELPQKQFMHIGSVKEITNQIKEAGFELVYSAPMGEISKKDAEDMQGTLFPHDDAYKSPIFYVCRKSINK